MNGWMGSLAEEFVAPASMAHAIPPSLDLELAALAEPLSVAVHATRKGGLGAEDVVNVIGAGSIGLLCISVAAGLGATVDLVTDIEDRKLDFAARLGAARPINVKKTDIGETIPDSPGGRASITIVAATAPSSVIEASAMTRPGGRIILVGLYGDTATIDAARLVTSEQSIVTSVTYDSSDFRTAIGLLDAHPEEYARFITRRITLDQVPDEFVRQGSRREFSLKTLAIPGTIGA